LSRHGRRSRSQQRQRPDASAVYLTRISLGTHMEALLVWEKRAKFAGEFSD